MSKTALMCVALLAFACSPAEGLSLLQYPLIKRAKDFCNVITRGAVDPSILPKEGPKYVDVDEFVIFHLPTTLGTRVNGSTWEQYLPMYTRLVSIDPFTTFEISISKELFSSTGLSHTVIFYAKSNATTTSGLVYGQEYVLSFKFDALLRIVEMIEYTDSLYSACFYHIIPGATCTALGFPVAGTGPNA